jgi:hypothetical protein
MGNRKMAAKPEVYFGACDRQMESFLDRQSFREVLVYGLLFHGDLVVTDIFFYISGHLKEALIDDPLARNFIIAGVRNGAIIPAFRSVGTVGFQQNLNEIIAEKIQGLHEKAEEIAKMLDSGLAGKRLYSRTWPQEPVSIGYKQTLERALLSQDILDRFPEIEPTWRQTKVARENVMGAVTFDSQGGIRRGDMYNVIHAHFNRTKLSVRDVTQIWAGITDQEVVQQAKRLIKWINYCYYYNQGRMIGLNPGFSALEGVDIQFARHLAQLSDGQQSVTPISEEFRLPSAAALLTIDPPFLFEVRDTQVGEDYFSRLADWRSKPTGESAQALLEVLRRYIAAINRVYLARGKSIFNWEWHLKAHVPPAKGRWGKLGRESLGAMAAEALGELIPHIGLASIVGQVAATTYETMPASWRDKIGPPLGIKVSPHLEIEITSERFRLHDSAGAEASFVKA